MRIVRRNVRVLDMVRVLLARALHRLCGTWCALRRWASAGHVRRWSTETGSTLLKNSSADAGVRPDECGLGECVLSGGVIGLSRPYANVGWLCTREGERA